MRLLWMACHRHPAQVLRAARLTAANRRSLPDERFPQRFSCGSGRAISISACRERLRQMRDAVLIPDLWAQTAAGGDIETVFPCPRPDLRCRDGSGFGRVC